MNNSVFDHFPNLETDRLRLRRLGVDDIPMVFDFNADHEALRYVPRAPYVHLDEAVEKVAGFIKGFRDRNGIWWAFVLKNSNEAIGYGGLFDIDAECSKAEIGYGLLKPFWRQGYASEIVSEMTRFAVEQANLHRVYGLVDPENTPSAKVLLKLGFQHEGCLHHDIFARGQYFDMDVFGLITPEASVL